MDNENGKRDFCSAWWLIFLTMVCVLALSSIMGVFITEKTHYMASFFAELSIFFPVFIGYRMLKKRQEADGIGFKSFPVGLVPYLLILPIVAQPFINIFTLPIANLTDFLFGFEEVVDVVPNGWSEWIFAILTLCVVAPVVEEILCRGILMQYMKGYGVITSIVVTSLVFSMLHFSPASFVILFFLGLLIGIVRLATDSIWACILMHSINNLFAFVLGLIADEPEALYIILLILSIILFPLTLYLFLKKSPAENRGEIIYKPIKKKGFSFGMLLSFLVYGIYSFLLLCINIVEKIMW